MADEFDLKPTSRGEEFLDVILRTLGGDTPDIPQPAWRYKEYLAAIANAIQNGGGGGGGGGSAAWALVVEPNPDQYGRLNKTCAEIWAAYQQGPVVLDDGGGSYSALVSASASGSYYTFYFWEYGSEVYPYEGGPTDYPERM